VKPGALFVLGYFGTSLVGVAVPLLVPAVEALASPGLEVSWQPSRPRVGDVAVLTIRGPTDGAIAEGFVGGRPVTFFREARGYAALVGFDMELASGREAWRIEIREPGRQTRVLSGRVQVGGREFPVQRLTLPTPMVDLDPETERRATAEGHILRTLYRTITPERLWRGSFVRPIAGNEPGTGFGSRRIINGQPRAPHSGTDYAAPRGTPVVSVNDGRVALVADYFFPGRLVVVDHGLGLYTLYFHLDETRVETGTRVIRGQPLGTVGSTGRATGPHLHFGVQVGAARVDPERLLALPLSE
jgi:murein DD-endopeptidase MepM/ murein hydrolase activator NlpD